MTDLTSPAPEWYIIAVALPIVGVVAGIVQAAKHRVGPALALWVTSWLAAIAWGVLITAFLAVQS